MKHLFIILCLSINLILCQAAGNIMFNDFWIGIIDLKFPDCTWNSTNTKFCNSKQQCIDMMCQTLLETERAIIFQPLITINNCADPTTIFDSSLIVSVSDLYCSTLLGVECHDQNECVNDMCDLNLESEGEGLLIMESKVLISYC